MESLQYIQLMLEFLKALFLVLNLCIDDLPDDVICDNAIRTDDTTLYSKYDQASDLWQQLELEWLQLGSNTQPFGQMVEPNDPVWSSLNKWSIVRLWTKWFWVRVQLQSLKLQISHLLRARSSLTFLDILWQLQSVNSLWNAYVTWQEHTIELESDLQDSVDCAKKWLVDFNTQLILFDWSNNNGSTDVKMGGSVLDEKYFLRRLGWPCLLN